MVIYTSHYDYQGEGRFDITFKTGNKAFSPTRGMAYDLFSGKLTEEEFTEWYINILKTSYQTKREEWDKLLSMDKVVLVCFCRAGQFCHRKLLAEFLVKYFNCEYRGEI